MNLTALEGTDTLAIFQEKVLRADVPVIVEFHKSNSASTFLIDSIIMEVTSALPQPVIFMKVNVDVHRKVLEVFHIQETPTVLLFMKGSIRGCLTGAFSRRSFISNIINMISSKVR